MRDKTIDRICATLRRRRRLEEAELAHLLAYIAELEELAEPLPTISESLLALELGGWVTALPGARYYKRPRPNW